MFLRPKYCTIMIMIQINWSESFGRYQANTTGNRIH